MKNPTSIPFKYVKFSVWGFVVACLIFLAACDAADTLTDNVTDAVDSASEQVSAAVESVKTESEALVEKVGKGGTAFIEEIKK